MKLKKIIASLAAVTMAIGMVGSIGASAYTSKGSWSVQYVAGSPSYPTSYSDYVTMYTYGGGYQTYCSSIYGGSDRYVGVSASGMSNFVITSTGYSTKKQFLHQEIRLQCILRHILLQTVQQAEQLDTMVNS